MVVAVAVVVATKPPLSRSNRGRSHQVAVEPQPCFVTKSVKIRIGGNNWDVSSRLVHPVANRENYNLGMVLDPVFA